MTVGSSALAFLLGIGGATWNSGINREQIRDCSQIMGAFIPIILEIMMDNNILWGQPCYPVVG